MIEENREYTAKGLRTSIARLKELKEWAWKTILECNDEEEVQKKLLEKADSMTTREMIHTAMKLGGWSLLRAKTITELLLLKAQMDSSVEKRE